MGDPVKLYSTVLMLMEEKYGARHDKTLEAKRYFAQVYKRFRKQEEANELNEEIVKAKSEIFGAVHWKTMEAKRELAQGMDNPKGLKLLVDLSKSAATYLGATHYQTIDLRREYASKLARMQKRKDAVRVQEELAERTREVLGEDHYISEREKVMLEWRERDRLYWQR